MPGQGLVPQQQLAAAIQAGHTGATPQQQALAPPGGCPEAMSQQGGVGLSQVPLTAASCHQQLIPAGACTHAAAGFWEAVPAYCCPTWTLCLCTTASRHLPCLFSATRLFGCKLSKISM